MERNPQEQINPATPEVAEDLGSKAIKLATEQVIILDTTNSNIQLPLHSQRRSAAKTIRP